MSTQSEFPNEGEASAIPPAVPESPGLTMASEAPTAPDQLPEYEPLTPELVEDEAVRGDFVIRWAIVLLAFMFGWTQIDDTSLLVRIRDGQQHPLPFGVDTFSASAGDRTWANLGWLSDVLLAGVYGVLGAKGLTILGAVVSALTFYFLTRTSLKGVSTWWGSVCGAVALVAAFPQLIPGPTGITLLGVTLVTFLLFRWSADRTAGFVWQIPATLWIWSQLDSRAWIGSMLVLLYALGWVGLRGFQEGDTPDKTRQLWKITGAGLMAWLLHPLHYRVLLSPLTAYQTEYPELREYKVFDWPFVWQWYPMFSPEFQERLNLFSVLSLGLCVLALLTFVLNYKRLTWEWLLPWVGLVALAVFCAHQLPAAALFSCALLTINAQLWYCGRFSQQYTVDAMPLAWNRGGRAITVVSLLLLGLFASNGMLMGRDGRRIGSGFSPQMQASITGVEKLAGEVASKEVFNFRLDQGDLLIWAGLKPYVDRRLSLYATGGENLLETHRQLRSALLLPNPKQSSRGKPDVWKAEFKKRNINHVVPRLSGTAPDYPTLIEMLSQGWSLSSLQSFGAVLSRSDSPDEAFRKYLKEHPDVSFVKQAFRTQAPKSPPTDASWAFPRRPTVYDTYLWQPQTTLNEPLQLASHELSLVQLMSGSSQSPEMLATTTALAMSAFRHARAGVALDSQSAQGYRILARSANFLHRIETFLASNFGIQHQESFWLNHTIHAFHHALLLDPDNANDHEEMASLQMQLGRRDLALSHMQQVYRLAGEYTTLPPADPRRVQAIQENAKIVTELKRHVKQVEEAVLKAPAQGGTWKESLQAAMQGQCSGIALRILEENRTEVAKNPQIQSLRIGLLSAVGRTEDALQQAVSLENQLPKSSPEAAQMLSEVRMLQALTGLASGDNIQLESLMSQESQLITVSAIRGLMDQAPLVIGPSIQQDLLVASEGITAYQALYQSPERWARIEFLLAQSEMSTWRNEPAKTRLKAILEAEPNVSLRPLIVFYLELLTGEPQQLLSPEMQAAADKAAAEAKAAEPAAPAKEGTPTTPPEGTPAEPEKTPDADKPVEPALTPEATDTPVPKAPPASEPPSTTTESTPAEPEKPE